MNIGGAAVGILKRGVELDMKKRYTEALVCYQEGLQILVDKMKVETEDSLKKYLRTKVEEYMNRAEEIKKIINTQKETNKFHETIQIENNSTGHSYKSLFGRFLDEDITYVEVYDPYVRSFHQCQNFLRLCELLVKSCSNMRMVALTTSADPKTEAEQRKWFSMLTQELKNFKVVLKIEYSDTLHDRQIVLSTGWIIKIGRGLDFYKPSEHKFSLGQCDYDLRPCHETTVDIIHSNNVKKSFG